MAVKVSDLGERLDWTVRENCTWYDTYTATDGAGAAIDITSYTITAEITAAPTSDAALKSFTVTKPDAANGQFRIEVDESAADLSPGTYFWSMQWNDGTNDVPLLYGQFVVREWTL